MVLSKQRYEQIMFALQKIKLPEKKVKKKKKEYFMFNKK